MSQEPAGGPAAVAMLSDWPTLSARRADVYAWFSAVFAAELTDEGLAAYRRGDADPLLDALANMGFSAEIERLAAALRAWDDISFLRAELAADFARLFLIDSRVAATPYASAYLDPKGQLYGEPHRQMRSSLQGSGLQVHSGFKEPADHLAVVLSYVETSLRRAGGVAESDRRLAAADQAGFLKDAVLSWLPAFVNSCRQLRGETVSDFYPALADLLLAFVSEDVACLEAAGDLP